MQAPTITMQNRTFTVNVDDYTRPEEVSKLTGCVGTIVIKGKHGAEYGAIVYDNGHTNVFIRNGNIVTVWDHNIVQWLKSQPVKLYERKVN